MVINNSKLNEILKARGLTKSALSTHLGISSRTIAKIKKAENINDQVVNKIAAFLKISIEDISSSNAILETLKREKDAHIDGGLYHATQIKLTYNSNHIEGSKLTEDQTRYIFETKTLGNLSPSIAIDDVIETNNHFKCIDYVLDHATDPLTCDLIKQLQLILKQGTSFASSFPAGEFKTLPNTVGGLETSAPETVERDINALLGWYNSLKNVTFETIVEFHYRFEAIHPFQDGNGRVGRLIAFKECLNHNVIPFFIDDNDKWLYYRGLAEFKDEPNYLIETCRFGQDQYRQLLNTFKTPY